MKIIIPKIKENPASLMRSAGYIFQHQENNEMSFIMPLARSGYPRFHIYAKLENSNLHLNLHLDQKKNTYGNETRHHGEYEDSEPVKKEAERLKSILQ
jgi:hypothetical protein